MTKPWRVSHYRQIKDATGHIVAVCEDPVQPNARLIVTACNNYEQVLEALKRIADYENKFNDDRFTSGDAYDMQAIANKAIRKAS